MSGQSGSPWRRLWGGVDTLPADELMRALGRLRAGPAPRPEFREELRAQLVAVTPNLVAEGVGAVALVPAGTKHRRTVADVLGAIGTRRLVRGSLAVTAVCALVLGVAVWLSGRSLPGDALYGLKRARESVELSFTHGTARGRKYLSLAHTRAQEASSLVSRADAIGVPSGGGNQADGVSGHVTTLIDSTLDSADSDLADAWKILLAQAAAQSSEQPIQYMIAWAPGQVLLLTRTADRLPAGAARNRLLESVARAKSAEHQAALAAPKARAGTLAPSTTDPGTTPGGGGNGTATPVHGESGTATHAPTGTGPGPGTSGPGGPVVRSTPGGGRPPTVPGLPTVTLPTVTLPGGLPTITLPTLKVPPLVPTPTLPALPGLGG